MDISPESLRAAAAAIRSGGTVVFPTETVYGLGANAWDARACARIYAIKGRPSFNPLIVHLAEPADLGLVASEVPPWAERLQSLWPGPLTLVLPKAERIPDLVTAGLPTVAVRVPGHPVARALIAEAKVPIAAPSANRFTRLSPTRVEDAREQLGNQVSFYLDGGPCGVGLESTIIGWQDGRAICLRPGGMALETIAERIGPVARVSEGASIVAPGMLRKHYSPQVPLYFEGSRQSHGLRLRQPTGRLGLVALQATPADRDTYAVVEALSPRGDLEEAAAGLFQALRRLEAAGLDAIIARPFPEQGLGIAINDRLRRASAGE